MEKLFDVMTKDELEKSWQDDAHISTAKSRGTVRETNKMGETLKEAAQAYEPPQTLNIADLDKIPIDLALKDGEGKDKDGEVFKYKYAELEGKQYRVAGSVLGGIKAILGKMPNLKYVSVIKQGQGMNTKYTVMPYIEQEEVKTEKIE